MYGDAVYWFCGCSFFCLIDVSAWLFGHLLFLSVLYASVFYFCICTCSEQLNMFHMEKHSRNTIIIIIIIIIRVGQSVVWSLWFRVGQSCWMSLFELVSLAGCPYFARRVKGRDNHCEEQGSGLTDNHCENRAVVWLITIVRNRAVVWLITIVRTGQWSDW